MVLQLQRTMDRVVGVKSLHDVPGSSRRLTSLANPYYFSFFFPFSFLDGMCPFSTIPPDLALFIVGMGPAIRVSGVAVAGAGLCARLLVGWLSEE